MQKYQPILSIDHNYEQETNNDCAKKNKKVGKAQKFTVYDPDTRTLSIDQEVRKFNGGFLIIWWANRYSFSKHFDSNFLLIVKKKFSDQEKRKKRKRKILVLI